MASVIVNEFKKYILSRRDPEYEIREFTDDEGEHTGFFADYAVSSVTLHEIAGMDVVELKTVNQKNQKVTFYLHFELKDLEHAKELFNEMIAAMEGLKKARGINVLLCCTSGITTNYFKSRMAEASEVLELDYTFNAVSYNKLYTHAYEADVILLAPQIGYLEHQVKGILKDKIVLTIPASVFASYDVSRLFIVINEALANQRKQEDRARIPSQQLAFRNDHKTVVVCILIQNPDVRICYRVYLHGKVTSYGEVIKELYRLRDLEDMLDVILAREKDVEYIMICTPGIYDQGHLTFRQPGIINVDVEKMFTERYRCRVLFMNDANAMALGYYGSQKAYDTLSFYFHPKAARTPGIGTIVNGHLMKGRNGLAGEMQFEIRTLSFSANPSTLLETPEGTIEIVSKYLINLIANVDPELIVFSCDMVPDTEELKQVIGKVIPKDYIPPIIKVSDCIEYMFTGGMMETAYLEGRNKEEQETSV